MADRLLLLLAFVAAVAITIAVARALVRRRTESRLAATLPAVVAVADPSAPTVVYFYGDHCAACPTQKRALDSLTVATNVVTVDAAREPALAAWAGVLTIPSTAIVDSARRLRAVNHGFQPAETLTRQLAEIA